MKRFILLLLACVLIFSTMTTTAFADYELPQFIRVGLLYGNSATEMVTLESDHGFALGNYNGREFKEVIKTSEKKVIVKIDEDKSVVVTDSAGKVLHRGTGSAGIKPDASGMEQKLTMNGTQYRGGIHCIENENKLTVVNVVFMDHYLYGVISREMSPSWHIEALKAQAVCARNYAAFNLDKHSSQGFDLCSNVHCQAYAGINFESDGSYAPVNETTRQVLTYDGELAQLYYCSSMGPTTEDVENVWGNIVPYLISVDNNYEDTENIPNGKWSGFLSCEEATVLMKNKGYDVGDVTNIEVLEYTDNNRVLRMKVTGTNGEKILERSNCRNVFNTVAKSQMFTVKGDGEGVEIPASVEITDGTNTKAQPINQLVILSSAGRSELSGNILYTSNGTDQKTYEVVKGGKGANTGFYFEGTGWGHSVGMSQYGAKGMAEKGFKYKSILMHYFPGTNLENAY